MSAWTAGEVRRNESLRLSVINAGLLVGWIQPAQRPTQTDRLKFLPSIDQVQTQTLLIYGVDPGQKGRATSKSDGLIHGREGRAVEQ